MTAPLSTSLTTITRALASKRLLGAALGDDLTSWRTWFATLKAAYAEPLTDAEQAAFAAVAGGRAPPRRKVRQFAVVVSRRAGKGRAAGALTVFEAALHDHALAPGEKGVVACVSPTRAQAQIVKDYALGFLTSSPILRDQVDEVTHDEIRLKNGNSICTLASDFRTLRGRTLLLAVLDEASFLRDESSASPDIEAARALLPSLSTTSGMLVILSSPYRRAGLLFQLHRDYFGKDSDDMLVVAGPSSAFNPTLDVAVIEAANAADPQAARSEWFGEFRADLVGFLDDASIDSAVDRDRPLELPPTPGRSYRAFVDPSGGAPGGDSYTVAIAHCDGQRLVVDVVRGRQGPFDPKTVTQEYAALCREYRINSVIGDAYGREWVTAAWREAGVTYTNSDLPASQLYLESLPLFMRGLVSLPDHPALLRELRLLERIPGRVGKDQVTHPRGVHDDLANSVCACLVSLVRNPAIDWQPVAAAFRQVRQASFGGGQLVGGDQSAPTPLFGGERQMAQMRRRSQRRW